MHPRSVVMAISLRVNYVISVIRPVSHVTHSMIAAASTVMQHAVTRQLLAHIAAMAASMVITNNAMTAIQTMLMHVPLIAH
jgi:hypothetical protein